jgi:hypothetical protein
VASRRRALGVGDLTDRRQEEHSMTVTRVDSFEPIMHHVDERRSALIKEVTP